MHSYRKMLRFAAPLAIGVCSAAPALAEEIARAEKPTSSWLSIVIAIVLLIAVGVGSFINPKRGHRD